MSIHSHKNLFRPIFIDRIKYFLIDKKPLSVDFEAPEMFDSNLLYSIMYMPKSIIQIVDPTLWYKENIRNNLSSHVDLSILFDNYPIESYISLFNNPFKVIVFFLNTPNQEIFEIIEGLNRFFLISSDDKNIFEKILSSTNLKDKAFSTHEQLKKKILEFTFEELNINPNEFNNTNTKRIERTKEILNSSLEFTKIAHFVPSINNIANLCQIFSLEISDIFEYKIIDYKERAEYLVETALILGKVSQLIKLDSINIQHNQSILNTSGLSTLIFSYPYFNPMYRESFTKDIKKKGDVKLLKQVRYARFIEQNIDDYRYNIDQDIDPKVLPVLQLKNRYGLFIDFVGYLHSTFESSPFIRVPARGGSLNTYISRLSPLQFKKFQTTNSLSKNLFDIGKALADNLPSEVLIFIEEYINSIVAISDLPIEWLLLKDIPLSFLCDICRIPETGLTSILSQYNTNRSQNFQIGKNILSRTLVICGAKKDDHIFKLYQSHTALNKINDLSYTTAHIQSKQEFFEIVNKLRPELLIFDGHGNFDNQNEGSYIYLGDEKLTGDDIVKNLPQVPLVILSCCWGTPVYGNSNTIAQAFFEKGSFSVISTFLPISITGGFSLYFRVLNNLAYATDHAVHESWLNFISHNIRTSYIDNILHRIMDKFSSSILEEDKYEKFRLIWQIKCMDRKTRYNAYKETSNIVLNCVKNEYKSKVENLLKSSNATPEFMLYTHLGRGDLIKFSSWIEKNKFE